MNWLKRFLKRKIEGKELEKLLLSLGKDKEFINNLSGHSRKGYTASLFAYLDVKRKPGYGVGFDLEIYKKYFHRDVIGEGDKTLPVGNPMEIEFGVPYRDLVKNPVLKKYVKGKYLEKSLAVLSVVSILASAFFLSNNITGNAILTTTSNSSGIIGAGLFVLGLVSWVFARKI